VDWIHLLQYKYQWRTGYIYCSIRTGGGLDTFTVVYVPVADWIHLLQYKYQWRNGYIYCGIRTGGGLDTFTAVYVPVAD
jgi:hypothetical protein